MSQDRLGKTPLHYAAIYGHVEIISSILTWCPDTFNIHDKSKVTPFVQSIAAGQVEVSYQGCLYSVIYLVKAFDMMLAHYKSGKVLMKSDHHNQCFLAAAYNQHTRILNTLKQTFCQDPRNRPIGYRWFSTTSRKV